MEQLSFGGHTEREQELYDFIEKYWKKSKKDLGSSPFDLEKCFTFIESKMNEARKKNDREAFVNLLGIRIKLGIFVGEVLSEFSMDACRSGTMQVFGKLLYETKPTVITFNYDTCIEEVIGLASGMNTKLPNWLKEDGTFNPISDEMISYCVSPWDVRCAYGIQFDNVQVPLPGTTMLVSGEEFYGLKKPYDWQILKLHGSLNWFQFLPDNLHASSMGDQFPEYKVKKKGTLIVEHQFWKRNLSLPDWNGWIMDPIIVPPTLYKDQYFDNELYKQLLLPLWEKARSALSKCKELIVIGYSFPPTDFAIEKLFLEAFADNHLSSLTVVNPDTSVVQKIKELCHFDKPVKVCKDLKELMKEHDKHGLMDILDTPRTPDPKHKLPK